MRATLPLVASVERLSEQGTIEHDRASSARSAAIDRFVRRSSSFRGCPSGSSPTRPTFQRRPVPHRAGTNGSLNSAGRSGISSGYRHIVTRATDAYLMRPGNELSPRPIAISAECLANRARSAEPAVILERDRKRACRTGDNAAIQRPNCGLAAHVGRNLNIVIRTRARARGREKRREREREREGVIAIGMRRPATRPRVSVGEPGGEHMAGQLPARDSENTRGTWAPLSALTIPAIFRSRCPLKKPSGRGRAAFALR